MAPTDPNINEPTFYGFVDSTYDALLLFEACLRGRVRKITRRLHEKERHLIASGSIFVFDERESGIKRWTDNLFWSPSRILGNFLIYRELDKKEPSGGSGSNLTAQTMALEEVPSMLGNSDPSLRSGDPSTAISRERSLLGSLTSSYKFKPNGLVKKTISVGGMHMICYYRVNDVMGGRLRHPSSLPEIASLDISAELLTNQNFRVPPKMEVGPDGQPRFVGEVDDGPSGPPGTANCSFSNRRRSASIDRQLPPRGGYGAYADSSEDGSSRQQNPARPGYGRSNSNQRPRYDPYARVEGTVFGPPISLNESNRRASTPAWHLAHIKTENPGPAFPSAPSPADSSSSGGYESQFSPYGAPMPPPARQAYQAGYEDPLTAFRNYQMQAGLSKSHYQPQSQQEPLLPFSLPSESSSLRTTAPRTPYYPVPHSPIDAMSFSPIRDPSSVPDPYTSMPPASPYTSAETPSRSSLSNPYPTSAAAPYYQNSQMALNGPFQDFSYPTSSTPNGLVAVPRRGSAQTGIDLNTPHTVYDGWSHAGPQPSTPVSGGREPSAWPPAPEQ